MITYVSEENNLGPGDTMCVCVCIPILVTTFPEWLSSMELLSTRVGNGYLVHSYADIGS